MMQNENGYNRTIGDIAVSEALFFIAYVIWLFTSILFNSFYAEKMLSIYPVIRYSSVLILLASEITSNRVSINSVLSIALIGFLAIIAELSSMSFIIEAAIFIYVARNIEFRLIAKYSLIVISLAVLIIILSARAGIITSYVTSGLRIREYLGFRYALHPAQYIFTITCLYIYLRKNALNIAEFILLFVINIYIYLRTDSRLSFYLAMGQIVIVLVINIATRSKRSINVSKTFAALIFPVLALTAVIITLNYNPSISWEYELNQVLGNRIQLGHDSVRTYGIHLLAQDVRMVGAGLDIYGYASPEQYSYVDSLYIQSLIRYGVLFTSIILILLTITCINAAVTGDIYLLVIQLFIALHCQIDDLMIYLYYNPFLFLIANLGTIVILSKSRHERRSRILIKE